MASLSGSPLSGIRRIATKAFSPAPGTQELHDELLLDTVHDSCQEASSTPGSLKAWPMAHLQQDHLENL